jgi:hypothetical protein
VALAVEIATELRPDLTKTVFFQEKVPYRLMNELNLLVLLVLGCASLCKAFGRVEYKASYRVLGNFVRILL